MRRFGRSKHRPKHRTTTIELKERNLLTNPCWRGQELGQALPDSPHAVSVALPRWQDVINYEEKEQACMKALQAVYPRFGLNPLVAAIAKKAIKNSSISNGSGWPYPNLRTAEQAKLYCQKNNNGNAEIEKVLGLNCLITDAQANSDAKAFWQHTGLGASSRQAAIALNHEQRASEEEGKLARSSICDRLSKIYQCQTNLIQLHPSGMAALTTALGAIRKIRPDNPFLQLGFPYVDVLKLPQAIFGGSELLIKATLEELEIKFNSQKPAAIIVELPSNPMLQCIDLPSISKLAHKYGIPVIADDTIGSALNIDPLPYADLIFSSLTKSFAGRGDILAGSLVISPNSIWKKEFSEIIPQTTFAPLATPDAIELEKTSQDVKERLPKLDSACLMLKRELEHHPQIKQVLHPETCSNFNAIKRTNGGYGCLLSFELVEGLPRAKDFYNTLQVCKGPSLGTNFTLVCPYVLLAHYDELEWAERCGLPAHLLRVSVGLEDPQSLWQRFKKALEE